MSARKHMAGGSTARVGQGYDVHRLVAGRPLRIGGVDVAHDRGLAGHSDGDVLLHALADALLGALGEGDLGRHFGSEDPALRGIDSAEILRDVVERVRARGLALRNVDATVVAQEPRLAPYQEKMTARLAELLGASPARVNVKVTSTDGLGSIGRGEGIAAQVVVLLEQAEGDEA